MIRDQSPQPGAPFRAWGLAQLEAVAEEIRRLDGLRVAPPLTMSRTPSGRVIGLSRPDGFYAVLSGNANPYSYAEVVATPAGWIAGTRTGSDAYEVNSGTGLDGKRVWLVPSTAPDKRFAFLRTGCVGSICVYWYDPCQGTDCSHHNNGLVATVTLDGQAVGTTGTPFTIDPTNPPCLPITKPGAYTITPGPNPNLGGVPAPVFSPPSITLEVADPCQDYEVCFRVAPNPTPYLLLTIFSCSAAGPARLPTGITVTITGPVGAPIVLTGPQFAAQVTLPGYGSYTVTIAGRRYQTQTLTIEVDACHPLARILTSLDPAPGFVCTCACNEPLSRQMALTDTLTGATGIAAWDDASQLWLALLNGTIPQGYTAPGNCSVVCYQHGAIISYAVWPCAANSDLNPGPNPETAVGIAWGQAPGAYPIANDPAVLAGCAALGIFFTGRGCPNGSDPTVPGNVVQGFSARQASRTCPVDQTDTFSWTGSYVICPFHDSLTAPCVDHIVNTPTGGTITLTEILPP